MPSKAICIEGENTFWLCGTLYACSGHGKNILYPMGDGFFCKAYILYYLITFFPFII